MTLFTQPRHRGVEGFPDPFCDIASLAMPENIQDALRWCEYIILSNGPYREAINRVISYFITDIEIEALDGKKLGQEEKKKYEEFLRDTIGIKNVLHTVALDYMTYGNSFTSMIVPFNRYLQCPGCGVERPLKQVYNNPVFKFAFADFEFTAECPKCNYRGAWKHIDRRSGEQDKIKVKRWSPHDMEVLWDHYTGDQSYIWRIPDEYRSQIRQGKLHFLERVSWEVVQTIKHNQSLKFDKDVIYHMYEDALAGIRARGWGISRILTNFRQAWYVQILQRFNEAIALDYVIPFRVITPMPRPGSSGPVNDPVMSINLGSFTQNVNRMLINHRRDPASWNILPFPIEYQAIGGEANNLAPKDLLDQGLQTLMSSIGVPIELFHGTLTTQAAPAALRLFEANWSHLTWHLNRFLAQLVSRASQILGWEPVKCRLQTVRHADDLNRQMATLQLMGQDMISRTTGLNSIGLDHHRETRLRLDEQRQEQEITQDVQQEMEQSALMDEMAPPPQMQQQMPAGMDPAAAAGGGGQPPMMQGMQGAMPGGGMPAPPAGGDPGAAAAGFAAMQPTNTNLPVSIPELNAKAETIANQLILMPESQKDRYLLNLKRSDETLHLLVKSMLDKLRRDMRQQGGDMLMQQMGKTALDDVPARGIDLEVYQ